MSINFPVVPGSSQSSVVPAVPGSSGRAPVPSLPLPAAHGDSDDSTDADCPEDSPAVKKYSRKDKSLGLLCENFLRVYSDLPSDALLSLDDASATLQVERRRIYDIVNILESVTVVSRKGKNQYVWHGLSRLGSKLDELRGELERSEAASGQEMAMGMKMMNFAMLGHTGGMGGLTEEMRSAVKAAERDGGDPYSAMLKKCLGSSGLGGLGESAAEARKEQSLAFLSEVFVKMFLANSARIVSLEDAARWLLRRTDVNTSKSSVDFSRNATFKSKVRRLYDIANVFCSLKLIEKIHLLHTRKPAFKWSGGGVYQLHTSVDDSVYSHDLPSKRAPKRKEKEGNSSAARESSAKARDRKRVKKPQAHLVSPAVPAPHGDFDNSDGLEDSDGSDTPSDFPSQAFHIPPLPPLPMLQFSRSLMMPVLMPGLNGSGASARARSSSNYIAPTAEFQAFFDGVCATWQKSRGKSGSGQAEAWDAQMTAGLSSHNASASSAVAAAAAAAVAAGSSGVMNINLLGLGQTLPVASATPALSSPSPSPNPAS